MKVIAASKIFLIAAYFKRSGVRERLSLKNLHQVKENEVFATALLEKYHNWSNIKKGRLIFALLPSCKMMSAIKEPQEISSLSSQD